VAAGACPARRVGRRHAGPRPPALPLCRRPDQGGFKPRPPLQTTVCIYLVYLQIISRPGARSNAHFRSLRDPTTPSRATGHVLAAGAGRRRQARTGADCRAQHLDGRCAAALGTGGNPLRKSGEHRTDRGNQPTQPQIKGDQTDAATVLYPTATPNSARSTRLTPGSRRPASRRGRSSGGSGYHRTRARARRQASSSPTPDWHRRDHAPDRGTGRPGRRLVVAGRLRVARSRLPTP
jgi:hypothetical protein